MEPALKAIYKDKVVSGLKEKYSYGNVHQVPTIEKVVLSSGFGKEDDRKAASENVIEDFGKITGQRAVPTRAKNAISNFKLRENDVIGARVTLRGRRMWEFLDRFINIAAPTIRDFRGLSPKQFDGNGNYTFGLSEQSVFHEIDQDKIDRTRGMDITVVTTATNDDEGRALLRLLGFPFKEA